MKKRYYCITCKNVRVKKMWCFCATCFHKADPKHPRAKLTWLIYDQKYVQKKRRRLAKREAATLAQWDFLLPTQKEYDEAAASALAFFLKKKDDAITSNLGKLTIISIAVVSKGGDQNRVQEMWVASLCYTYLQKSNLLKIVRVDEKDYWRNPSTTEHWDIKC